MLDLEKREMLLQGIEAVIKEMENRYSISELEDGVLKYLYNRYRINVDNPARSNNDFVWLD